MQEEKFRIFVVDDDPASRMVSVFALEAPGYELHEFESGAACLAALDAKPDLILLDVEMPGMDGYETCRALRTGGEKHAQVLFLSSHNDLKARMAAYDAGGDDFLVKPCPPQELACKTRAAERARTTRDGLVRQADYATNAAFTAMTTLGEMGSLLEFFRSTSACDTYAQLARGVFQTLHQFGLEGVLEIRASGQDHYFAMHGECSELEKSIISHVGGMERIFQFRDRLVVNYPRIVLLIQNLPLDDPDRAGRLRDHLAMLAEGIQPRLMGMESELQRRVQADGVKQVAAELARIVRTNEQRRHTTRLQTLDAGNGYLANLERAFIHMGLNETQEQEIYGLARGMLDQLSGLLEGEKALGDELRGVLEQLTTLASA